MKGHRSGFTLTETLAALVVLGLAFMLVFALLQASLRYSGRVEREVLATVIASGKIEEIREWAAGSSGGTLNYDSAWAPYDGVSAPDPNHPEYRVYTQVQPVTLESLSSMLESQFPFGQRKQLAYSVKEVKVTVSWQGGDPTRAVSLVTCVAEPQHVAASVVVSPASAGPLARDSTALFAAVLYDTGGNPVHDMMFEWSVRPGSGDATLAGQARDGSSATLANYVMQPGGTKIYTGGTCQLEAEAVYWGTAIVGDATVSLTP